MATVIYSFAVKDNGVPATGLTPTITEYRDIGDLTDYISGVPTVTEVGGGHYKFSVDWDTTPESSSALGHISVVIDAGATITENSERYITARINSKDDFAIEIAALTVSLANITTKTDSLFEVATGKWEVASNQLHIYESDGTTLVKTFNLFDASGSPTSTLPARREPI